MSGITGDTIKSTAPDTVVLSGKPSTDGAPWFIAANGEPGTPAYVVCGHNHRSWPAAAFCARGRWPAEAVDQR